MSASVHTDLRTANSALVERYHSVRQATDSLRARLTAEDQMVQSMPDCSPAKWHAAHTTWFFETFLLSSAPWYKPVDPRFRDVFNSYYKQVGDHPFRGDRGTFSHPTLDEVHEYRERVDSAMERLISSGVNAEQSALIELGLNHEQQHQELIMTDIKHAFWSQPLRPAYVPPRAIDSEATSPSELRFISFEGGLVQIGHDGNSFSFDNELPRHTTFLQPFGLASRPVTNGEYIAFINDNAYSRPELWLSDGWDTITRLGWKAPLYWEKSAGEWKYFTLSGQRSIDLREPVCHISFYEADAYARWSGARLPTEAEWEHAAASAIIKGNFADDHRFHPAPASSGALQQLYGDVWEWTGSAYLAYPGFRPAEGVVGEYNGKFMCNQFVLRGGSCATPRSHIRATYRNFFPPHARWQFTGVRLAKDER